VKKENKGLRGVKIKSKDVYIPSGTYLAKQQMQQCASNHHLFHSTHNSNFKHNLSLSMHFLYMQRIWCWIYPFNFFVDNIHGDYKF